MNRDLKMIMEIKRVKQWQVAEALGLAAETFCRKLRKEVSPEFRSSIIWAVNKISSEQEAELTRLLNGSGVK